MRFLPSRETHDSRVRSFVWTYFLLYGDLKMWVLIQGQSSKVMRKDQIRCHGQTSKVKVIHERHIAWAHFVQFGALKIHLLTSLETHVLGYLSSFELIFCILEGWKCDLFRVVKPMLQGYVASCEHFFFFMATWKCVLIQVHAKRPNSWPGLNVKVKHERHIAWAHFVHFGALKIQLLPSLETHVQGYVASCELIFCILAA